VSCVRERSRSTQTIFAECKFCERSERINISLQDTKVLLFLNFCTLLVKAHSSYIGKRKSLVL